jgi:hypothetical protein
MVVLVTTFDVLYSAFGPRRAVCRVWFMFSV